MSAVTKLRVGIMLKLDPVIDYVKGQKTIEQYRKDNPPRNGNGVTLPKEVLKTIMWLAAAILIALGGMRIIE